MPTWDELAVATETKVLDRLLAFHKEEAGVILHRITAPSERKHTRHWQGSNMGEVKALDPLHIVDMRRWLSAYTELIVELFLDTFTTGMETLMRRGSPLLTAIRKDPVRFLPVLTRAQADTYRDRMVEGHRAYLARLGSTITTADQAGDDVRTIQAKVNAEVKAETDRQSMVARRHLGLLNLGRDAAAAETGAMERRWVATHDPRTRPSHVAADGQEQPIGKPFVVGPPTNPPVPMMSPGDPFGPPRESYNCRCSVIYRWPPRTVATEDLYLDEDLAALDAWEADNKGVARYVRTPEGARKYGQPIGSLIIPDPTPDMKRIHGAKTALAYVGLGALGIPEGPRRLALARKYGHQVPRGQILRTAMPKHLVRNADNIRAENQLMEAEDIRREHGSALTPGDALVSHLGGRWAEPTWLSLNGLFIANQGGMPFHARRKDGTPISGRLSKVTSGPSGERPVLFYTDDWGNSREVDGSTLALHADDITGLWIDPPYWVDSPTAPAPRNALTGMYAELGFPEPAAYYDPTFWYDADWPVGATPAWVKRATVNGAISGVVVKSSNPGIPPMFFEDDPLHPPRIREVPDDYYPAHRSYRLVIDEFAAAGFGNPFKSVVYTRQSDNQNAMFAKKYGLNDFSAAASNGGGHVTVYDDGRIGAGPLAHEGGHSVDYGETDAPIGRYSFPVHETPAYADAALGDYAARQAAYGTRGVYKPEPGLPTPPPAEAGISPYGTWGARPSEDFAEAVYLYLYDRRHGSIGTFADGGNARFADLHPNRARILDEIGAANGSVPVDLERAAPEMEAAPTPVDYSQPSRYRKFWSSGMWTRTPEMKDTWPPPPPKVGDTTTYQGEVIDTITDVIDGHAFHRHRDDNGPTTSPALKARAAAITSDLEARFDMGPVPTQFNHSDSSEAAAIAGGRWGPQLGLTDGPVIYLGAWKDDAAMEQYLRDWGSDTGMSVSAAPGYDVAKTREIILTHEFGHNVMKALHMHSPEAFADVNALVNGLVTTADIPGSNIPTPTPRWQVDSLHVGRTQYGSPDFRSVYANENPQEWFAEAFADGIINHDNPSPAGKAAVELAEKYLGRQP